MQSLNTNSKLKFKIKYKIIKTAPKSQNENKGIWTVIQNGNKINYNNSAFSLELIEEALNNLMYKKQNF